MVAPECLGETALAKRLFQPRNEDRIGMLQSVHNKIKAYRERGFVINEKEEKNSYYIKNELKKQKINVCETYAEKEVYFKQNTTFWIRNNG